MSKSVQHVAFMHDELLLGGAEMVTLNTIKYLSQTGIFSTVFTYSWNQREWSIQDLNQSCRVLVFPKEKNKILSDENISFLVSQIKKEKIEILFFVTRLDKKYAQAIKNNTNCKVVLWLHSIPFWEITATRIKEQILARKSFARFLRFYGYSYWRNYLGGRFLRGMQESYIDDLRLIDYMLVLCQEYKNQLKSSLHLSLNTENKILTLINTISINPSPTLQKNKEIAYLGRLNRDDKQLHKLLYSWKILQGNIPDWSLNIYGSGTDENRLKEICNKKNLERVIFHGYEKNTQMVYDKSAIVCLTSSFEGWPMVLIEAQNNGCIPVSFNCCLGVQSIIGVNSEYGILVPQDDVQAFANALLRLCSSQELRTELQNNVLKKRLDYVPSVNEETWNKLLGKSTDREEL